MRLIADSEQPMTLTRTETPPLESRHYGPSPGWLGVTLVGLFVVSLIAAKTMSDGARFPTPYEPAGTAQAYFAAHTAATRVTAFLQFLSAVVLGIYAAAATSRLTFLGVRAAGVPIALFGGVAASILLAVCALGNWVLSQPSVAESVSSVRLLQMLGFAFGGAGHVVAFGLLLAGLAVAAGLAGYLPRWLFWCGLLVATFSLLSMVSLLVPAASFFLPLGRYLGFLWIIAAGFALPGTRKGPVEAA